jgi:hypothetical protein
MPTLEPSLAGLTNSGKPRRAATAEKSLPASSSS